MLPALGVTKAQVHQMSIRKHIQHYLALKDQSIVGQTEAPKAITANQNVR